MAGEPGKCQGALSSPVLGFSEQAFFYLSRHPAGTVPVTGGAVCSDISPGKDLRVLLAAVPGGRGDLTGWWFHGGTEQRHALVSCPPTDLYVLMRGRNKSPF